MLKIINGVIYNRVCELAAPWTKQHLRLWEQQIPTLYPGVIKYFCIKQTTAFLPQKTERARTDSGLEAQLHLGPCLPVTEVVLVFSVRGRTEARAPASRSGSLRPHQGRGGDQPHSPLLSKCAITLFHHLWAFAAIEHQANSGEGTWHGPAFLMQVQQEAPGWISHWSGSRGLEFQPSALATEPTLKKQTNSPAGTEASLGRA